MPKMKDAEGGDSGALQAQGATCTELCSPESPHGEGCTWGLSEQCLDFSPSLLLPQVDKFLGALGEWVLGVTRASRASLLVPKVGGTSEPLSPGSILLDPSEQLQNHL